MSVGPIGGGVTGRTGGCGIIGGTGVDGPAGGIPDTGIPVAAVYGPCTCGASPVMSARLTSAIIVTTDTMDSSSEAHVAHCTR